MTALKAALYSHTKPSLALPVIHFCVLFLTLSLSLLKISMQETPYAVVESANRKIIFVPANTHPLIGDRKCSGCYILSLGRGK